MEEQPGPVTVAGRECGASPSLSSAHAKGTLSVFFVAFCLLIKDRFLFLSVDGTRAGGKGSSEGVRDFFLGNETVLELCGGGCTALNI